MHKSRVQRGRDLVKAVYGSSLQNQGRGFYVPMEFFALLRGTILAAEIGSEASILLPHPDSKVAFRRPTHDFARRLMAGEFDSPSVVHPISKQSVAALKDLLRGLELPVPGRRGEPGDWRKRHFYPFPADFVHYDALDRRGKIVIERDSYRGGGELVHRILRADEDQERLDRVRAGFARLLSSSLSPLGSLARALQVHDETAEKASEVWVDALEFENEVHPSPWVEHLRAGIDTIVSRDNVPASKKIEALMTWIPFCVVGHQLSLAMAALDSREARVEPMVFDCLPENGPLRNRARQDFNKAWNAVKLALKERALEIGDHELVEGPDAWMDGPKSFFAQTAFAVGACNASTGTRWFTLRTPLLESIVLAMVPTPVPFERFCREVLYGKLGIICDDFAARRQGIVDVDQITFSSNSEALAETLLELGALERYSDTTRMVSYR
jgi:hypothetical protein